MPTLPHPWSVESTCRRGVVRMDEIGANRMPRSTPAVAARQTPGGRTEAVVQAMRSRWHAAGVLVTSAAVLLLAPGAAFGTTTVPSVPRSVAGVAGPAIGHGLLTWTAPASTGGGIDTYLYDVSTNYNASTQQGTFSALVNLNRNTTTAMVPCSAVYPAVCTYRVYPRNAAGTSGAERAVHHGVDHAVERSQRVAQSTELRRRNPEMGTTRRHWWACRSLQRRGQQRRRDHLDGAGHEHRGHHALRAGLVHEWHRVQVPRLGTGCSGSREPAPSKVSLVNVAPGHVGAFLVTHSADDVTTGNAISGSATMTITWAAPTTGLHDGPYEFQECSGSCVERSQNWSTIELIPNGTLTATRTCPPGAITCSYRVRATNERAGVSTLTSLRYVPGAPSLTSVGNGTTHGTVAATFGGRREPARR